ncbi:PhnD/SsuA/transferrin family substrate-binding protein [Burkholderia sp. Ax-1719]|jgi:sulfonate transport system substrate-binding protein|uniref:PhnD/SsuA/transferrin family substrate-binding protein n=1 Tax=Burkholderia sp. Ax-1719 TaxID=2608334 RepID=UPI00141E2F36|nr:PhnD/SsuA/transferrin family substrate-binding protein [Burkholderia sp. Ax-1719]NIE63377.1 PhnD/SsuA/transferrin family substrate-binding protein [Burkholderia sp. Ax-1719]
MNHTLALSLHAAKRRLKIAFAAALGLSLAAAAPVSAMAQDTPQVVRIAVVAWSSGGKTQYAGASALIDADKSLKNALAARHIKLQWVPVSTAAVGTLVNEGFASGTIDFAGYGDLPSVVANAAGTRTKLIVPGGVGSNTYLVVPENSSAKSILDLKGKRIALNRGRPWEVSFNKLLAANGLKLSDFRIFNLDPQAGAAAVAAGRVDGFFTLADAWSLADKHVGKIIWSTKNAPDDWKMRAELWGDARFVAQHPDITQIVADAYVRAAWWISQPQNRDAFVKILSASGQPESVIRREYDGEQTAWKQQWAPLFTPALSAHYRDVAAYSAQARLASTPVDVNSLLAPQFVANSLKSLKLDNYWSSDATNVAKQ